MDSGRPEPDEPWQPSFDAQAQTLQWTAVYVAAALGWIFLSDPVAERLLGSEGALPWPGLGSAVAFVLVSGAVLYLALRHLLGRLARAYMPWQQVVEEIPDAVWLASADRRRLIYLNRAAREAFAEQQRHLTRFPEDWRTLVHRDDQASMRELWAQRGGDGPREITFRLLQRDGSTRWLRCRFGPLRHASGVTFATAGVATDVTESMQARRNEQDARRQLQSLVDSAMDAIISVDAEQRVQVFNRAAAATFGVSEAAALGQPLDRFIPAPLREVHREQVKAFMDSGVSRRSMRSVGRLTGLRADQTEFPIDATISRSLLDGQPTLTVILRDATDLRRAEHAERGRLEAEASDRAKSEFMSRMSHEVRTPLNAVIGFAELMLADRAAALSPLHVQRLNHVRDAAWHLLAVVDDVLDLSRLQTDRLALNLEPVSLEGAVAEAIALCEDLARRHRVAVFAPPPAGGAVLVQADPLRLRQVLVNLVSNAIKYNEPEGGVIVDVSGHAPSGLVRVVDSGAGMTQEQVAHLFEPFNRLGRERSGVEGTGIGLVLARELAELMRGRLHIRSMTGRGTEATLSLPLAPARPEGAATPVRAEPATPAAGAVAGTVLCIEDDPVNAQLMRDFMALLGPVRFQHAAAAAAGLEMAVAATPDLIFLDLHLPDAQGLDVLRDLRRRPSLATVPVIVLSADTRPELQEAAAEAGATAFWTKPLDFGPAQVELTRLLTPARPDPAA